MKFLSILVLSLITVSCSTMSKEECASVNWKTAGYQDGSDGSEYDEFIEKNNACREHGIAPNKALYLEGYKEGLKVFCTEENGFAIGSRGSYQKNICPAALEASFQRGYDSGLKQYKSEQKVRELRAKEDELKRKESELQRKEEELKRKEDELRRKQTRTLEAIRKNRL